MIPSFKIVFFGTSCFAATILRFMLEQKLNIAAVVTRIDKPKGRHLKLGVSPVKQEVQRWNLPLFQPVRASSPEFVEQLYPFRPDLFVVAAYGEILKQALLDLPPLGAINIHASVLPKYRGAAPIQRCLMEGERETGISIIRMVLEMDAGDILGIQKIPIAVDANFKTLEGELARISGPALLKVLTQMEQGTLHSVPQDHTKATFAPKISPLEEKIDWTQPAIAIHNLIRAFSPTPGAWCSVQIGAQIKRLKILKSEAVAIDKKEIQLGDSSVKSSSDWIIPCGTGGLKIQEVQLEGKKPMTTKAFLNGLHEPFKIL